MKNLTKEVDIAVKNLAKEVDTVVKSPAEELNVKVMKKEKRRRKRGSIVTMNPNTKEVTGKMNPRKIRTNQKPLILLKKLSQKIKRKQLIC